RAGPKMIASSRFVRGEDLVRAPGIAKPDTRTRIVPPMADDTQGQGNAPSNAQDANQGPAPSFGIAAQYVRDLSFESPNAPASLVGSTAAPTSQVNVSVQVKK